MNSLYSITLLIFKSSLNEYFLSNSVQSGESNNRWLHTRSSLVMKCPWNEAHLAFKEKNMTDSVRIYQSPYLPEQVCLFVARYFHSPAALKEGMVMLFFLLSPGKKIITRLY